MAIYPKVPLSKNAAACLIRAGWTPSRRMDVSVHCQALREEGYRIFPEAKRFLERFVGLRVTIPAYKLRDREDFFHLDPREASRQVFIEQIRDYEERIGESLVVIGEAYSNHLALMISETGKILGGFDRFLVMLGEDGWKGMESLYQGVTSPYIQVIDPTADMEESLNHSLEIWPVLWCAEMSAVNDALMNGSKLEDLVISTLRVKSGEPNKPCYNCRHYLNKSDFVTEYPDRSIPTRLKKKWKKLTKHFAKS
ncbi:SUKH-3 domain-containing protein [Desmospora profundinema]|uniref:Uncharacterized protein n=1 Tax=Desmospora profundinema TaxID=1571184 RepID=A0ABU1IP16_9BACL|nr:SUKH-3 domain-containing protein [Desmospora profundinema]MDR6226267.1 hypothetical protein [Desmospora profundinema]